MSSLNILETHYKQTGKSRKTDANGMLEMQARAFKERQAQYLLIKSPPASGKSRAMMFLALDKLRNQGVRKVIVAVPEMSIGASFKSTNLIATGFSANWHIDPKYNLCIADGESGKVRSFVDFIQDEDAEILLCTHATLRFAFQRLKPSDFDNILLGVDEFHHSSADESNILGALMDSVIEGSTAHIVAMTGSYFRGDAVPVMAAEYESLFTQVTYSYYEQLNGYQYLKSLGMNYHFYKNGYLSALSEVLDTTKKTIIHIPNVNSFESTKRKYDEVDAILDVIGQVVSKDNATGILSLQTEDGRILKVADLVNDDKTRRNTQMYLSEIQTAADVDIIIALGMAKEGFDWVWCEHVLTVGYRSSLTEVIQIIGRATRDCEGKEHAQFTNLISQPDAENDDVARSVNNLLKAITVSLLMMQVLTPNINFKPRSRMTAADLLDKTVIAIDDSTKPLSDKATQALNNIENIKAALMQKDKESVAPLMTGQQDISTFIDFELPKIISEIHPDLTDDELAVIAKAVHASLVLKGSGGFVDEADMSPDAAMWQVDEEGNPVEGAATTFSDISTTSQPQPSVVFTDDNDPFGEGKDTDEPVAGGKDGYLANANRKFALIDGKFIDVEKLNFNLIEDIIESTNPFEGTYSVLSKSVTTDSLRVIEAHVSSSRSNMTDKEAYDLYPLIKEFNGEYGRPPQLSNSDHYENRLALALALIKDKLRRRKTELEAEQG